MSIGEEPRGDLANHFARSASPVLSRGTAGFEVEAGLAGGFRQARFEALLAGFEGQVAFRTFVIFAEFFPLARNALGETVRSVRVATNACSRSSSFRERRNRTGFEKGAGREDRDRRRDAAARRNTFRNPDRLVRAADGCLPRRYAYNCGRG